MRYGIETWILRHLPAILLAGLVPGAACALVLQDVSRLVALAFVVAWMLGLVRFADSYAGPAD
jgi:hypothetical protein